MTKAGNEQIRGRPTLFGSTLLCFTLWSVAALNEEFALEIPALTFTINLPSSHAGLACLEILRISVNVPSQMLTQRHAITKLSFFTREQINKHPGITSVYSSQSSLPTQPTKERFSFCSFKINACSLCAKHLPNLALCPCFPLKLL